MTVEELDGLLEELDFVERQEDYRETYRFSFLASVMANLQRGKRGRRIKPEDFIGKPPKRQAARPKADLAALVAAAKEKGLAGPWSVNET